MDVLILTQNLGFINATNRYSNKSIIFFQEFDDKQKNIL